MPRWQQHKIILPDGDILSLCSISDCGAVIGPNIARRVSLLAGAEKIVARQPRAVLSIHAQAAPLQGIASRS